MHGSVLTREVTRVCMVDNHLVVYVSKVRVRARTVSNLLYLPSILRVQVKSMPQITLLQCNIPLSATIGTRLHFAAFESCSFKFREVAQPASPTTECWIIFVSRPCELMPASKSRSPYFLLAVFSLSRPVLPDICAIFFRPARPAKLKDWRRTYSATFAPVIVDTAVRADNPLHHPKYYVFKYPSHFY